MTTKFKTKHFVAPMETASEVKKGVFSNKTNEVESERSVDIGEFSKLLQQKYEEFDSEGYEVINVLPVSMGHSEEMRSKAAYLGQVGFSVTCGAVLFGKIKAT